MRAKRIKLLILIFIIIFSAAGCWDSRDAEDKDIVISVAVDKTENRYVFYVKVASISTGQGGAKGGSEQSAASTKLLISEGKSFIESRENLDRISDNPIFLGATQTVILTERLAYSGIGPYMLRLRQTPEYRKTLDVVVTNTDPKELLEFQPENAQSVGFAVESTIKSLVDTGQTFHITLGDVLGIMASHNKCYLLHTIALTQDIAVTGYSVFDNDKCVGFIPIEESKGVLLLKANEPKPYYNIQYSEGEASIRIRSAGKHIKPVYKNGEVIFDVNLNIDAQVISLSKNTKLSESEKQDMTASFQRRIMDDISKTIRTSQVFCCDYLNFYTFFRIAYPEEVKSMNWKDVYSKAIFNISVKAKVDLVSTVNYSE